TIERKTRAETVQRTQNCGRVVVLDGAQQRRARQIIECAARPFPAPALTAARVIEVAAQPQQLRSNVRRSLLDGLRHVSRAEYRRSPRPEDACLLAPDRLDVPAEPLAMIQG